MHILPDMDADKILFQVVFDVVFTQVLLPIRDFGMLLFVRFRWWSSLLFRNRIATRTHQVMDPILVDAINVAFVDLIMAALISSPHQCRFRG